MSKDLRYNKKELDPGFEDNMYLENHHQIEERNNYAMKKAKKAKVSQAKARRDQFNQLHWY